MPALIYADLPFADEEFGHDRLPPAEGLPIQQAMAHYDHLHDLEGRDHDAPVSFKGIWDAPNQCVRFWTGAISDRGGGGLRSGFVHLPEPPQEPQRAKARLEYAKLAYEKAEREFEHAQQEALHHAGLHDDIDTTEADLRAVAEVARWWAQAIDAIEAYLNPPVGNAVPTVSSTKAEQAERLSAVRI